MVLIKPDMVSLFWASTTVKLDAAQFAAAVFYFCISKDRTEPNL
jgi:hypothetical protein